MRQGELFALTPADLRLDDKNPHLLVDWTLTEGEEGELVRTAPKTKASRRRVDLDPETVAILKVKDRGPGPKRARLHHEVRITAPQEPVPPARLAATPRNGRATEGDLPQPPSCCEHPATGLG